MVSPSIVISGLKQGQYLWFSNTVQIRPKINSSLNFAILFLLKIYEPCCWCKGTYRVATTMSTLQKLLVQSDPLHVCEHTNFGQVNWKTTDQRFNWLQNLRCHFHYYWTDFTNPSANIIGVILWPFAQTRDQNPATPNSNGHPGNNRQSLDYPITLILQETFWCIRQQILERAIWHCYYRQKMF